MRAILPSLGALVVLAACKVVSQGELDAPAKDASVPALDATPSDGGVSDSGLVKDSGKAGVCGRVGGALPTLPELGLVQGQPCVHNRQCESGTYCEDPTFVCMPGPAGAGRPGVGPCKSGNDCTSGLCVQNATGAYTCSDACDCNSDCSGLLPKCVSVATLGIGVCARP